MELFRDTHIDFMKYRKFWIAVSCILVLAAASYAIFGPHRLNLGIDFAGGTQVTLALPAEPPDLDRIRSVLERAGDGRRRDPALRRPRGPDQVIDQDAGHQGDGGGEPRDASSRPSTTISTRAGGLRPQPGRASTSSPRFSCRPIPTSVAAAGPRGGARPLRAVAAAHRGRARQGRHLHATSSRSPACRGDARRWPPPCSSAPTSATSRCWASRTSARRSAASCAAQGFLAVIAVAARHAGLHLVPLRAALRHRRGHGLASTTCW